MIVMRRAILALMTALVVAAAVVTTGGTARGSATVRLYFVSASGSTLIPIARIAPTATPREVVSAILAGPNGVDRRKGAASSVPRGVRLVRVISSGARASVALQGSGLVRLSTIPRLRVIASLTYTLTGLPTIRSVRFTVNGLPWGVYNQNGRIIRDYRRGTLAHPWLTACAPADGCFTP